jgi:hypothetical protein
MRMVLSTSFGVEKSVNGSFRGKFTGTIRHHEQFTGRNGPFHSLLTTAFKSSNCIRGIAFSSRFNILFFSIAA